MNTELVVAAFGAVLGIINLGWQMRLQKAKASTERELQDHRARLDQLGRLHARRVEKIEDLHEAVASSARFVIPEEMTGPPPQQFSDDVQPDFGRRASIDSRYAAARIYLSEASDNLFLELFEHLDQVARSCEIHDEVWRSDTLSDEVRDEFDKFYTSRDSARRLVDELRVALRQDIEHGPATSSTTPDAR